MISATGTTICGSSSRGVASSATAPNASDPVYGDRPLEKVTLQFDVMDGAYNRQNADGGAGAAVTWQVYGPSSSNCP
jgi:hypothetical protein